MTRSPRFPLLPTLLLAACGGAAAEAQPTPPGPGGADPARIHLYEVPAAQLPAPADTGVIRVRGQGSVSLSPDRVRVTFAVETQGRLANDVARDNAALMRAVMDAVRGARAPGLEVETFGYTLQPVYSFGRDAERTRRIDGYSAVNMIRVTSSDPAAAGALIDAAIGAGANRVASLLFDASDTAEARREALRMAVRSAREEAEAIVEALGRTLGPPLEVVDNTGPYRPQARADMRMAVEAAATPVEAAETVVTADVSVVFALGPPR